MLVFLTLYIVCFLVQVIYFLWFIRSDRKKVKYIDNDEIIPVSVVICARNEEENLKKNLPKILNQKYPNFEVTVVNDRSTDHTQAVLEGFQQSHPQLRIVNSQVSEKYVGKKKALTQGIKAAKYEWVLLTDADCYPSSDQWIFRMTQSIEEETEIVLGYGPYEKYSGCLNQLIRLETFFTARFYFTAALKGKAYMGVGRNLMYTKSLFLKEGGFEKHEEIFSGDDDLFVNQAATKTNTKVCLDVNAWMHSTPPKAFSQWMKQKQRHYGASIRYSFSSKILLGLFSVTYLMMLMLLIPLIFYCPLVVISLILLRISLQLAVEKNWIKSLEQRDLFWRLPIFEVVLLVILPIAYLYQCLTKPTEWN